MAAVPFGSYVPNYDTQGHQHFREPYKDKGHLLTEDIRHPKWLDAPPPVRTRTELHEARRRARIPDSSYDFDGDGAVGHLDFFIGRSFDKDRDGRLTDSERLRAREALDSGFLDRHEKVTENSRIRQRNGVMVDADNNVKGAVDQLIPAGQNSGVVHDVKTRTALLLSRRAELKGVGTAYGEKLAEICAPVIEPVPPNAQTEPRQTSASHLHERQEADHQNSRVRAGLLAENTPINPERDLKEVGLDRVEAPFFGTRSQLMETRKALARKDCEDLRRKGEEVCVPNDIRKTAREANEFDFRKRDSEPMTRTTLLNQRRRDKIEYELSNFKAPELKRLPQFADRPDVPFWALGKAPGAGGEPVRAVARTASEPVLKVTDVPFGGQVPIAANPQVISPQTAARAGKPADENQVHSGSHTIKRWTTDMLERGQGRNKPRLFDNIQPVRIGPLDLMPLEITSSMECIRNAACKAQREEHQKAQPSPLRSLLFNDNAQSQLSMSGGFLRTAQRLGSGSQRDLNTDPVAMGGSSQSRRAASLEQNWVARSTFNTTVSETMKEPRFFGSMTAPLSETGVRSGGFQRFEPPPKQARILKGARSGRSDNSSAKERGKMESREASAPPGGAQSAQQPLPL